MKKFLSMMVVGVALVSGQVAIAGDAWDFIPQAPFGSRLDRRTALQDPPPAPSVVEGEASEPMSVHEGAPVAGQPVALFHCVKYSDRDNIHPCAVAMVVSVPDPCQCHDPCSCCTPSCVNVQICVPPCGCPKIKTSKHGRKVTYDYGKYEVEIESKDGVVSVDYDD